MISIIDYGIGNLGSVQNMLKKVGVENEIISDTERIAAARKIIFPGVGAFPAAMDKLREKGIIEILNTKVLEEKTPILGICLGMQLMTNHSDEGGRHSGLGWIDAATIRFQFEDKSIKVPHKGWNYVQVKQDTKLFPSKDEELRFYFDHSYFVQLKNHEDQLISTAYGQEFTSGFHRGNVYGVQFHPEKSHRFGLALFKNFAAL
jgi:imidazole glycerol-phosphate synthase subunit HisH